MYIYTPYSNKSTQMYLNLSIPITSNTEGPIPTEKGRDERLESGSGRGRKIQPDTQSQGFQGH